MKDVLVSLSGHINNGAASATQNNDQFQSKSIYTLNDQEQCVQERRIITSSPRYEALLATGVISKDEADYYNPSKTEAVSSKMTSLKSLLVGFAERNEACNGELILEINHVQTKFPITSVTDLSFALLKIQNMLPRTDNSLLHDNGIYWSRGSTGVISNLSQTTKDTTIMAAQGFVAGALFTAAVYRLRS
jgi:hypothetical protein